MEGLRVLFQMVNNNIFSWTALVPVHGLQGYANEAIENFREMERQRLKPDKVSFLAVLSACRHAGLVQEGMDLFSQTKNPFGLNLN